MKTKMVDLRQIASDPIAEQLMKLPEMQPYIQYAMAVLSHDDEEAALNKIRGIPLDKRYLYRILTALEWGFADFDNFSVSADLKTLESSEVQKLIEDRKLFFRPLQLCLFLQVLTGPKNMEQLMLEAIKSAKEDQDP